MIFSPPSPAHASEEEEPKNILILNSYHSGFTWTDDQTDGIISSLDASNLTYNISTEYLDWKRYPSQENLELCYQSMKLKYQKQKIDIIICTDDTAFSFATQYRNELFSDAPIVFSGINTKGLETLGTNETNFTGVLEVIDPKSTIEAALSINPSIDTIYLIYDNTESGISTGTLCIQAAREIDSNLKIRSLNNLTSDEIINEVEHASKNTMILVTTYSVDHNNQYIYHQQFCEELYDVSPVPIYHIYDFANNHGVLGGYLTSGRLQGEEAGKLAVQILQGADASSIPIIQKGSNHYIFDYSLIKEYKLDISNFPKGSTFFNEPFSFFKTYRILVIFVVVIFSLMLCFTLILLFYIHKIRSMQKVLKNNNEELAQLYEEQTAIEEELRNNYLQLANAHDQMEGYNEKLYRLAHHDSLTGLYNRLYLYEEVEKNLSHSQLDSALLFVDIDNFKYVNDALGHSLGDELLKAISCRLKNLSSEKRILIRLGGDEFVFFIYDLDNKHQVDQFTTEIINIFSAPFKIQENTLSITISIGVSLYPENGENVDTLLRNADMAMYKVKENGKNGVFYFNQLIKDELLERINIEKYFKKALAQNEFQIYYQPQIVTETTEIDGFEALIRWDSPELGMLSPYKFIHIAEENGFIISLGEWILRASCQFIQELNQQYNKQFKISVNISAIQLFQENFVTIVKNILNEQFFPPELLELEITESIIMESTDLISEKLQELRALGVRIALDDFGTGYSSLAYLKHLPITTLKVDKLFIDDIVGPNAQINLADTIIDLGHKMNLTIVAEGVETSDQAEYLRSYGCDKIQGYFYSKPICQQSVNSWLEKSMRE
jgi:diguanylate cyclase (GGDEF)-like protein